MGNGNGISVWKDNPIDPESIENLDIENTRMNKYAILIMFKYSNCKMKYIISENSAINNPTLRIVIDRDCATLSPLYSKLSYNSSLPMKGATLIFKDSRYELRP